MKLLLIIKVLLLVQKRILFINNREIDLKNKNYSILYALHMDFNLQIDFYKLFYLY